MSVLHMNPLGSAIGWALLHFLWEGSLLGLLAWLILRLARRRSPEFRYVLACGSLAMMVLGFVLTVRWQMVFAQRETLGTWLLITMDGASSWANPSGGALKESLQTCLPMVLLVWLLGASFMMLRLGSGFLWLYGSCLRGASPVDALWKQRFHRLLEETGLSQRTRLLSSEQVDSPLVMGWLRPVILVPSAAFAGMDPDLLEAVLVHELAHIKRWDFLANLLQSLAEVLFFFHPAVWWISRQIRREREHCCDDAAVLHCGDSLIYASALAVLEALRIPTIHSNHLAPAAKGGSLMLRIERLLKPEALVASGPSSFLPVLSAFALVLSLGLFGQHLQAKSYYRSVSSEKRTESTQEKHPVAVPYSKVRMVYQPPPPPYPKFARENRIQGVVVLNITIGKDGIPKNVKAISGPEELKAAAEEYARAWRFSPVEVEGKVVEALFALSMPFKLRVP